jgi:putative flippase GtrA
LSDAGINPRKPTEAQRMIKFALVGALGFFVDAGSLYMFTRFIGLSLLIGQAFSFSVAVVHNFILNRIWTFPESREQSPHKQMIQFYLTNLVGLIIRSGIIAFIAPKFERFSEIYRIGEISPRFISDYASLSVAVFIVMIWNYTVSRHWTFRHIK